MFIASARDGGQREGRLQSVRKYSADNAEGQQLLPSYGGFF